MSRKRRTEQPGSRENPAASGGTKIVFLFLATTLQSATILEVCPTLHELIHYDADDKHHDCAVTLFLAGQVEQPAIDPILVTKPAPVPVPIAQSYETQSRGSCFVNCRILEHARHAAELNPTSPAARSKTYSNVALPIHFNERQSSFG